MRDYVLIGDIHSQYRPLWEALAYCQNNARIPVILGDVFDSRCDFSDSAGVYQLLKQAQKELGAIVLRSNHQDKLERYIRGNNVHRSPELVRTIEDFEKANISLSEVGQWLETMPYGFCFRDSSNKEYRCAHAYFPSWLEVEPYEFSRGIFEVPRKVSQLMMYGPNSKEGKSRVFWWNNPSERSWVRVAGHYHVVHSSETCLVLDAGCGGKKRSWFCDEPPALVLWDAGLGKMVEIGAQGG